MFRSLRSRLLLSYGLITIVTLLVVFLALLALGAQHRLRFQPALQRLDIISRSSRAELIRLRESNADRSAFRQFLVETAESNNVRVLITTADNVQVGFDSDPSQSWLGFEIEGVELPRNYLPTTDPNAIAPLHRTRRQSLVGLYQSNL